MRLSASTLAFSGYEFSTACDVIAQTGFAFVEPAFVPGYGEFDGDALTLRNATRLREQAAAVGLSCRSVSAHVDMSSPDAVGAMRDRLDFAAALGARYLVTNSGVAGREDAFASNIEAVAGFAADRQVVICIENPGHGSNTFRRGATMAAWKKRFAHPFIDLNYDFGNIFTANDERVDPAQDMLAVAQTAAHFHVKDILSDADGWHMCPIGSGSIDYVAILRTLAKLQSRAALSVEMPLRLWRPDRGTAAFRPAPPLTDIATGLKDSLAFIERHLRAEPITSETVIGANPDVPYD